MATITNLNDDAYEVTPDNLVLAGELPQVRRILAVKNPTSLALARGMAIIADSSSNLYVAGPKSDGTTIAGDIVAVVAEDMDLDTTSATIPVDCYVFGAFNAEHVSSIESLDITTAAYVLGAQGNGIYLK